MTDLLITDAVIITMDAERRVIEKGAVAIDGSRIAEIGESNQLLENHHSAQRIEASGMVLMPGLIDCHAHAGHGLVKTMGGDGAAWTEACEIIYTTASSEAFWRAAQYPPRRPG